MIVGEALGENEATLGEPFVGMCGKTLKKMLADANIPQESYYITNTVKCWPYEKNGNRTKNRPPTDEEITACKGWLWKEIQMLDPYVIITLGKVPTYTLLASQLKKNFKLDSSIGKEYKVPWCKSIIYPLYHPSYIMQYGKAKMQHMVTLLQKVHDIYGKVKKERTVSV